jgi:Lipid A core - O-antigen ligase and related enzymes
MNKTTAETVSAPARADQPYLFWSLLTVVVLSPLPLGSVDGWSWGLLTCLVAILMLLWAGAVLTGRQTPSVGLHSVWPVALLYAATIAWAWLQTRAFMPAGLNHPLWELTNGALGWSLPGSISVDAYATTSAIARLLAYGGIFWLALQYGRRSSRARTALVVLSYAGMAYALYGLVIYLLGFDVILIFRKTAYLSDLTSTFVNRNSYATFAGLGLICATGLITVAITKAASTNSSLAVSALRVFEEIAEKGWPLVVCWLILLLALVFTHSRAGFFSTILGLVAFLIAAGMTRAVDRRLAIGLSGACAVVLALFLLLNGHNMLVRLLQTSVSEEDRPLVYERVIEAIGDSSLMGTGYGTFAEVFRFYRTPDIQGTFTKAHSVYLENALELGLPAALSLFAVVLGLGITCFIGIRRRRRDAVYPCVGLAATVLVAVHSIVDFSLQIPAVAATYAFLMGITCAQCWSSRRPEDAW